MNAENAIPVDLNPSEVRTLRAEKSLVVHRPVFPRPPAWATRAEPLANDRRCWRFYGEASHGARVWPTAADKLLWLASPFGPEGCALWVREPYLLHPSRSGSVWYKAGVPVYAGGVWAGAWAPYDRLQGDPLPSDPQWRDASRMPRHASRYDVTGRAVGVVRVGDSWREWRWEVTLELTTLVKGVGEV